MFSTDVSYLKRQVYRLLTILYYSFSYNVHTNGCVNIATDQSYNNFAIICI